jgi:hypothetical protein
MTQESNRPSATDDPGLFGAQEQHARMYQMITPLESSPILTWQAGARWWMPSMRQELTCSSS